MLAPLRALIVLQGVIIAQIVLSTLLRAAGFSSEVWENVNEGIGLLESGAAVAALAWLFRARREELLQAALVLAVLELVLELGLTWRFHFSSDITPSLWLDSILPIVVEHAATLLLWLALARLGGEARAPAGGLGAAFFGLWGVRFALWTARAVFSEQLFGGSGHEQAAEYLRWSSHLSAFVSVALNAVILVLVARIARHVAAGDAAAAEGAPRAAGSSVARDVTVGAIWLGAGVVVTAASFASVSRGGGRYFVAYGAIIFGLARIVRGLGRRG